MGTFIFENNACKLYLEGITITGYQREIKLMKWRSMLDPEIHKTKVLASSSIFVMDFTSKLGNSGLRSCLISWSYFSLTVSSVGQVNWLLSM